MRINTMVHHTAASCRSVYIVCPFQINHKQALTVSSPVVRTPKSHSFLTAEDKKDVVRKDG